MRSGSANFGFLKEKRPRLEALGGLAERYFPDDPNTSLLKARQFGELLSQIAAARLGAYVTDSDNFVDTIRRLRDEAGVDRRVIQLFHQLRIAGNEAAHTMGGDHGTALSSLKVARQLAVWFHKGIDGRRKFSPGPFIPPQSPLDESESLKAELQELRQTLAAQQAAVEEEAAKRLTAEEQARQEAEERTLWESLAQETEAEKLALAQQLQEAQAAASAAPAEQKQLALQLANEAAEGIDLDERDTRRLVDVQLRDAGWEADSDAIHYKKGVRPQKGRNLAIAEWRTETGPVDYALFVGLQCIGLVEAKRKRKDVSGAIDQAKRYGKGFSFEGGAEPVGGPWPDAELGKEQRVPFLFATNGRPYLKQIETKSGIWFWDARKATNLRRAVQGWYTPEGLTDLLRQDEEEAHKRLEREPFNYGFKLRPFQEKAIRTAETKLGEGQRDILLAMATGTGKTKTCIALVYRLLKTKRFRRVLFLVDRTALGEQAANAFKDTRMESLQTFADIFDLKELGDIDPELETKVHISTIQAQVKRILFAPEDQPPPVDRYDCIVVDECHRGYLLDREMSDAELSFRDQGDYISKYRRVLEFYDAAKIGLTATPALHTVDIFGKPAFTYGYREAVLDGWLVDHEPPVRIVTALAKAGIKWKKGETLERINPKTGEVVDLSLAPDEIKIEVEGFNKKVITKPFNKVVCRELANHIDPGLDEKTLIFCATDHHADIVVDQLKKAFAAKYGEVEDDAVQKITGAADKPRQRIRTYRNERLPNVAVTVDLLTTGIDVPKISNLVFIRRVNSRILYEQMLGRGTRLCPEIGKECFRIYDAVDLYSTMGSLTTMKPVAKDPDQTFAKLVNALEAATEPEAKREFLDQIIAKLHRRVHRMSDGNREAVEAAVGQTPEDLLQQLVQGTSEQAEQLLGANARLIEILDRKESQNGGQLLSHHADSLHKVEHGYGEGRKPEGYLDGFAAFLKENMNKIPALLAVTQRPRELTRKQLKELALLLEEQGYREIALQTAWRDATNQDIAAGIIGFIRRAALGDPLLPYAERVKKAMVKTLSAHPWTAPQRKWLERIGKQLEKETVVDREALDRGQFAAQGGFNRINKAFDGRLEEILGEISEALWEKTG